MNETENNLLLALKSTVVTPSPVIEFRIYYNDDGNITMCTTSDHPESLQYIVVNQDQFNNYYKYKVVDNKLVEIKKAIAVASPLVKSDRGFRVVKNHAALLLEESESFNPVEYYEPRRNS